VQQHHSDVFGQSYRDATLSVDVDDGAHVEALDIVDGDLLRLLYGSPTRPGMALYVLSVSLLELLVIAGGGSACIGKYV
jgi:hypothetical protein